MKTGIVIKNENGYYHVHGNDDKIRLCRVRGRLKKTKYSLLVGDQVDIEGISDDEGFIETIHPRKNSLQRPAVANIDQVMLVVAAHQPDINENLLNKLLVMIEHSGIPLTLVINKWDLKDEVSETIKRIYGKIYPLLTVSAYTGDGLAALRGCLDGKITAFAGPSGVGKSSLLNAIEPSFAFQTGAVSEKIKRGRHTTRHASLYSLDEHSFIMDTPGFSAIDFSHIDERELPHLFPEFYEYEGLCRFAGCSHTHEPACALKEALKKGEVSEERYDAYLAIRQEILEKR